LNNGRKQLAKLASVPLPPQGSYRAVEIKKRKSTVTNGLLFLLFEKI